MTEILISDFFFILRKLEEYLPFSFLQSNTIFIDSTIYPGCWHSPSHLPISDIYGFGQGPFLPHRCTVGISENPLFRSCSG